MKSATASNAVQDELGEILSPTFPGIIVELAHSARWNRPCVTFRSRTFNGLLPEERFHRLVGAIPAAFREKNLAGVVWVELAEDESLEEFLKLPRSEDVTGREREIYVELAKARMFDVLAEQMGASPDKRCSGDFREMAGLLSARRFPEGKSRDAKLLMIRHHAYCDCQVVLTAWPALRQLYAGAA